MAQGSEGCRVRICGAHDAASRGVRALAERVWKSRHKKLHGRKGFAETLRGGVPQIRDKSGILLFPAELVFRKGFQEFHVRRRREKEPGVSPARRGFKTTHK